MCISCGWKQSELSCLNLTHSQVNLTQMRYMFTHNLINFNICSHILVHAKLPAAKNGIDVHVKRFIPVMQHLFTLSVILFFGATVHNNDTFFFLIFFLLLWQCHHFEEPLVLSVLDFGGLCPRVLRPGWMHHCLRSMSLACNGSWESTLARPGPELQTSRMSNGCAIHSATPAGCNDGILFSNMLLCTPSLISLFEVIIHTNERAHVDLVYCLLFGV